MCGAAEWDPDELIGVWTLVDGDWELIATKAGATRLGFAVILKFYELEGRFPAYAEEVPQAAVGYVASLVKVDPALFAKYSWRGRTIKYHRAQIRQAFGTRPASEADGVRWARLLAEEMCPTETSRSRLAEAVRQRCRSEKVSRRAGGAGGRLGVPPVRGDVRRPDRGEVGAGGVWPVGGAVRAAGVCWRG
ncbi:DUF4158 domain-containing protein [Actinomadura coerulea]|uniref:DUF4158 domain-containing protein n=1 Tax=Actinomadura coerulea TaxID=46159 RepID=UPI00343E4880